LCGEKFEPAEHCCKRQQHNYQHHQNTPVDPHQPSTLAHTNVYTQLTGTSTDLNTDPQTTEITDNIVLSAVADAEKESEKLMGTE